MLPIELLMAIVAGYAAAVLFFFARKLKFWPRTAVFVLLGAVVLGSAFVTGKGAGPVRCVVALLPVVLLLLHMWDLHLDPRRESRLRLRTYMVFLLDYAWSVARVTDGHGVNLSWKQRGWDAARYVAGLCLVSILVVGAFRVDWHRYPFWLEHSVKSTCLGACAIGAFQANTAFWRLAGAPAAFFTSRSVLGAYSPAEFWRRWNRPMYWWFLENIYRPAGGRRHPYLAGLASFAISGLLHEYLYAVTLRFVTGYVLGFFLLHGIAAALTRRCKPTGWLAVPAILVTFAFNTLSTVLLFIPINERVPFYVNAVPRWLHLW
ncbi:MAG: MBOAT family protein [Phycisphaerae bacterium]|nr:MBOAT family protein [Phycisphaerae bacterium]